MLILMNANATPAMIARVCEEVTELGLTPHPVKGVQRTVINVTGNKYQVNADRILTLEGVHEVISITKPYKLVSRESHPEDSHIDLGGTIIGGAEFVVMAGPCSIESREQAFTIAEDVARKGARVFRGGAFKPRTSPYSFQGLGLEGLKILAEVREKLGLLIVTEAVDTETLDMVAEYADIIQIGARNMQNYSLLKKAGRTNKPVLVKRGMSASLDEFLMAAEYVMVEGNPRVILCERGVRTFSNHNRNVLDLSAITYVKKFSHLPIIADPSHGSGQKYKVIPLSRAALAVGADGLLVEVHHEPDQALSDGPQAITLNDFEILMNDIKNISKAVGRTLG